MAMSKPLLTEFGIHHRLESCGALSVEVFEKARHQTCLCGAASEIVGLLLKGRKEIATANLDCFNQTMY